MDERKGSCPFVKGGYGFSSREIKNTLSEQAKHADQRESLDHGGYNIAVS